jgi:glyoxylase-like metal-dependent hydrolase (beta-lactamase superfamily II)
LRMPIPHTRYQVHPRLRLETDVFFFPNRMFDSLARVAREIADDVDVFPGHAYAGAKSTIREEKKHGLLKPFTKTQWMAMHQR